MKKPSTPREPWIPSRRVLIGMVVLVALGAAGSTVLQSGLGGEPIVDYNDSIVDVRAIDNLTARGENPCPAVGDPRIPADLAHQLEGTQCVAYDTSAGLGPAIVGLAALGAVIVITSGNRFGLYMVWISLILVMGSGVGEAYVARGLVLRPGSLPLPELVAFLFSPTWVIVAVLLVPRMVLIFPTGRLPSHRWRWVTRATFIPAAALVVSQWMSPLWAYDIRNPLPIEWSSDRAVGLFDIAILIWIACVIASFSGLLWRFATATGEERQQLKWVAYAVALALIVNVVASFVGPLTGTVQQVANFVILPTAVLFSIFKFRLYDIDRLINRTVVYGLVTILLAMVFAALIVLPQTALIGAQGLESEFVALVAVATLVVASVFNPLRRRIQRAVDRRFNRTGFDARRVVEGFQERLNLPGDVDEIVRDVSSTVGTALEPDQMAVLILSEGRS